MKQKKEIWRDIIGYEDYYQVSNLGNVKSLDRTVLTKTGIKQFHKGRIFKGIDNKGYKQVTLSKDGKQRIYNISQLVAMAYLNHTPDGGTLVVDHINGVKTDNRVKNLRIVTHRENISTCYRANEGSFTSDFVGVYYHKQRDIWRAQIQLKNKITYLGSFENEKDASDVYQKALDEINNNNFNPENYRASFTSNYKGVSYYKNTKKWLCQSTINGEQIHLGYYNNEEDASNAYQKALDELENGTFKIEDYRASFASKYKGISYYKKTQKYMARATIRGERIYLGSFDNELEAHQAILEYESIQPIVKT